MRRGKGGINWLEALLGTSARISMCFHCMPRGKDISFVFGTNWMEYIRMKLA